MTRETLDELNRARDAHQAGITDPTDFQRLFAIDSRGFVAEALSRNTARVYTSYWKTFVHWCELRRLSPLPASSYVILEFVKECSSGSVSRAPFRKQSIAVALAAIKHAQRNAGFSVASSNDAIEYLRTVEDAPVNVEAATYEDLRQFLLSVPNTLDGVRLKCVLTLIYEELLRLPELIALGIDDYFRGDERHRPGLCYRSVVTRGGKQWHPITQRSQTALEAWIDAAQVTSGQLLRPVVRIRNRRKPLGVAGLNRVIRVAQADWRGPRLGVRTLHRGHVLDASMPETQREVRREQEFRMGAAGMAFRWRDAPSAMERYTLARGTK